MSKRVLSFLIMVVLTFSVCVSAFAVPPASPTIGMTSLTLSTSMVASFMCSANGYYDISVSSVKLEVKNADGSWSSAGSLTAPASVSDESSYHKTKDYSSSCTKGKTYRISATFTAGGSSVSRTSGEATYK